MNSKQPGHSLTSSKTNKKNAKKWGGDFSFGHNRTAMLILMILSFIVAPSCIWIKFKTTRTFFFVVLSSK